jgi:hypothetical protein
MVSPRVPSQLRYETVVLVPVVVMVRKYEVGNKTRLKIFEHFLNKLTLEGEKSVAKSMNDDLILGAGQEGFRRSTCFLDALRVLAGENNPFHFETWTGFSELQNRTTSTNLDVVTMSAQAKYALYAS